MGVMCLSVRNLTTWWGCRNRLIFTYGSHAHHTLVRKKSSLGCSPTVEWLSSMPRTLDSKPSTAKRVAR